MPPPQELTALLRLHLPYISPTSPLHLPYIAPVSPLYLPYLSPTSPLHLRYFCQAFPSSGGPDERSTYLFTYLRPGVEMPSLLEVMEDYWAALPAYQGIGTSGGEGGGGGGGGGDGEGGEGGEGGGAGAGAGAGALSEVEVQRIVFGWFPTYRRGAPLPPRFDRVLSVGGG